MNGFGLSFMTENAIIVTTIVIPPPNMSGNLVNMSIGI